ncbi:hypothetical protein [Paenibacillus agilis]|uniref:Uncharacterized protein n=1 Tax=Paenibacillus agilis TaxID=3020863 RepID=A0A559IZR1_9BACL|nr:hypothetical protein [Paenibacillus agilis]TVX93104.1 hypothetical protein FPZ44_08545 [Paenibacillus agilis]
MNENVRELIAFSCAILIFVGALSMAVNYYQSSAGLLNALVLDTRRQDRTIHENFEITAPPTIKGADIVSMLTHLKDSNVAIEVDGYSFLPEMELEDMPVSFINVNRMYVPEHNRDASGRLLRIQYR